MHDADGPVVAKIFYEELFKNGRPTADDIPYALDAAVSVLRESGVSADRWAPFVHFGA
jgi:hypothetical protein